MREFVRCVAEVAQTSGSNPLFRMGNIYDLEKRELITIEGEKLFLEAVPQEYQPIVFDACQRILDCCDDVCALILIGSVAEGDFGSESDVDLLCVKKEKISFQEQREITKPLDSRMQVIFFDEITFHSHFEKRTTMAHSVKNGVIIYENKEFASNFLKTDIGLPTKEWMKDWTLHWLRFYELGMDDIAGAEEWHQKYCDEKCTCHISEIIARVVVNLSILFLETHGIVPTTKSKIKQHFEMKISDEKLVAGVRLALTVSRQERYLNYDEAKLIAYAAKWLRDELISILKLTCEDLIKRKT
jgi:predicted nucleotidyltransferase